MKINYSKYTTKLVKSKYSPLLKRAVLSWKSSRSKYLTNRENFVVWAHDYQGIAFKKIAEHIKYVSSEKDDDLTGEGIRQIYLKAKVKIYSELRGGVR